MGECPSRPLGPYLSKHTLECFRTSFLLNEWIQPGKSFNCKKAVWQGDPLSPLLFVLVANLLQSNINEALSRRLLSLPQENVDTSNFAVVEYVLYFEGLFCNFSF